MTLADFPKLKKLPSRQKLQLAEELWFDGVSDEALPVPDWHKEILSKRLTAYKKRQIKTISVSELKRGLGSVRRRSA
jgi:putative addiction module component